MSRSRALTLLLGVALLAAPVLAQGNPTGKLIGRVTNEGVALPGVTVNASSPALQGSRLTVTGVNGDFVLPNLPPGDYTISFELQGMDTVTRSIKIAAAQTVPTDVEMQLATLAEEIVVTGSLETISQSSQAASTFSQELVDDLPTGRTLVEIVALQPGVHEGGFTKDTGTGEQGTGALTISGAATFENLFLINGVVLNENLRGQAFDLFIEDAVQETTTATAGISAEYGRFTGGVVNLITKSGGNEFHGSLRATLNNQDWTEETDLTTSQTDDIIPAYEATLGGFVLRDRLWFFLAGRMFDEETTQFTSAPTTIGFPQGPDQKRYEGKLTFALTPNHSFIGSYMEIDEVQRGNRFGTILDLASVNDRETPQELFAINYNGVLSGNFYLTGQYSEREFTFINAGSKYTDLVRGTLLLDRSRGNARYNSPTFCGVCLPEERNNENALLKASYFLSSESLGSHDLVFGYDTFNDIRQADNHQSGSDYRIFGTAAIIRGTDIYPQFLPGSTWIQFNPIAETSRGTDFKTNSLFVNDSWRLSDRWTINLGLRYDENDGKNSQGRTVADDSKVSPRLAASFDPKGDGDLQINASYATYVAALSGAIADGSSGAGVPATLRWIYNGPAFNPDPDAANLLTAEQILPQVFEYFFGLGCPDNCPLTLNYLYLPGDAVQIRQSLDSPSADEFSLGVTKRIGARGIVRADVVRREWHDFYASRVDRSTGQVDTPLGPADLVLIENNDEDIERTYDGVHTQWRFRFSDRLDVGGNYTWSKTEGNFEAENRASGPISAGPDFYPEYADPRWNAPKGYLSVDQRHRANLYAIYQLLSSDRQSLNVSGFINYGSGKPYSAVGLAAAGSGVDTTEYVGDLGYETPPSPVDYFFSRRGALRTPDIYRLDLSLNYAFQIAGVELLLSPEVINVTNEQEVDTTDTRYLDQTIFTASNAGAASSTRCNGGPCQPFNPFTETPVEGVHWAKGPNFGKPINQLAYQLPRTYRLSLRLSF